jgi:hypothetical protein
MWILCQSQIAWYDAELGRFALARSMFHMTRSPHHAAQMQARRHHVKKDSEFDAAMTSGAPSTMALGARLGAGVSCQMGCEAWHNKQGSCHSPAKVLSGIVVILVDASGSACPACHHTRQQRRDHKPRTQGGACVHQCGQQRSSLTRETRQVVS